MRQPEQVLLRWKASLPSMVSVAGLYARCPIAHKWKSTYRSLVLRESLFWRTFDLLTQAEALHSLDHTLGARVLLRSALETVALLVHLNQVTEKLISGSMTYQDFDAKTRRLLLGSRDGSTKHQSVSTITVLEHCDKRFPGLSVVYATLCESAHPNFEGVCIGYSDVDHDRDETHFSNNWSAMWADRHEDLFILIAKLFEYEYNEIWPPQLDRLEAWLVENDSRISNDGTKDA